MKTLRSFLSLIRYQNLLIIIFTQYLMRLCVLKPLLFKNNLTLQFDEIHFALLVLSTVFITAAGYVINDYFDRKTDMVNRPDTVIIGKYINRRFAMTMHLILNIIGVFLGVYLSFYIGIPFLSVFFFLIAGLLWFYSTTYKRQFLIGNIVVAFLTGFVPLMVGLFEFPMLNKYYAIIIKDFDLNFIYVIKATSVFAFFAFLTTLIREIIKDTEDYEGDKAFGRNSVPIVLGIKNTKIIINFLIFICIAILGLAFFKLYNWDISFGFTISTLLYLSGLVLCLLYLGYTIFKASEKKDYSFSGDFSKVIMLIGLGYAFILNYFL